MQRLLSLATIGLILAAGWMFFNQSSAPSGNPAAQNTQYGTYPVQQQTGYQGAPVAAPAAGNAPTIRIASFNIQVFGKSKEQNQPVMMTLAAIMRNFDIIAIQEIRIADDDYLLKRFLDGYLKPYSKRPYEYVLGPRLGRSVSKEQYAYIYDASRIEVNQNHIYTVRDPDDLLHREPFVAMFRTREAPPQQAFTFVLVDVHTDPDEVDTELNDLAKVYQAVRSAAGGEDDIILLGDLNVDDQHLGELGRIPGVAPLISGVFTNTRQTKLYDNILLHRPSTAEFTGRAGVYDMQRYHNLNQEQALQVSDHLPVWAEFSIYESAAPGRVAALPQ